MVSLRRGLHLLVGGVFSIFVSFPSRTLKDICGLQLPSLKGFVVGSNRHPLPSWLGPVFKLAVADTDSYPKTSENGSDEDPSTRKEDTREIQQDTR